MDKEALDLVGLVSFVSTAMGEIYDTYSEPDGNPRFWWGYKVVVEQTPEGLKVTDLPNIPARNESGSLTLSQASAILGYCTINKVPCDIC